MKGEIQLFNFDKSTKHVSFTNIRTHAANKHFLTSLTFQCHFILTTNHWKSIYASIISELRYNGYKLINLDDFGLANYRLHVYKLYPNLHDTTICLPNIIHYSYI